MSRRNLISALIADQLAAANSASPSPEPSQPRVAAGPVRTMGLSLDRLESERKSLEAALANGSGVIELDPAAIEGSFAADRFTGDDEAALADLKASIAASGQEVPILVRPLPGQSGRYQAAYGHRRLAACRALGIKVKALVRGLSDSELVIAQGLENAARVDLSFIEKACFARGLEDRGFDRMTIMAALGTDKTELSKLISAARGLPEAVVRAIGPAPKAGRRRWLHLAQLLADPGAQARVMAVLADPDLMKAGSDARLVAVLEAASRSPSEAALSQPVRTEIRGRDGQLLARLRETPDQLSLQVDRAANPAFADFLVRELPDLYGRFLDETEPAGRR